MSVSEERLEEVAELASDGPSALDDDDVADLLAALTADGRDLDRDDTAENALEALVEASEPAELYDLFSPEQLAAASGHEDRGITYAVGEAFELLIEVAPAEVSAVHETVIDNVENEFPGRSAVTFLYGLIDAGELGIDAIEPLFERDDNTLRNIGARAVETAADDDTTLIEETMAESALSAVEALTEQATNRRERHKLRENALDALAMIANQHPEAVLDRTVEVEAFVAELDHVDNDLRGSVYDLLAELVTADPTVADHIDAFTTELDDPTRDSSSRYAVLGLLGAIAEHAPTALGSEEQDRYLDLLDDGDVSRHKKRDIATVLGVVGDEDALPALLGYERFDDYDEFTEAVVDVVDREDALDALVACCDHDDPRIRANALSVLAEEYGGAAGVDVVDLCLTRLDDRSEIERWSGTILTVRGLAGDALASLGEESAADLGAASDELLARAETAVADENEDGRNDVEGGILSALETVARTDGSFAERMVADLDSDDPVRREIAADVLRGGSPEVQSTVDLPVGVLVDLLDDENADYDAMHLLSAVGDERPEAVESAIEPVVERYGNVDDYSVSALESALAAFTYHYPERTVGVVDSLGDRCEGRYVSWNVTIALSNLARDYPERVAEAVEPAFEEGLPGDSERAAVLVLTLGDAAPAPLPDDWSAESLSLPDGQNAIRLARLLADVDDERATALLDRLATESESDRASTAACEALGD